MYDPVITDLSRHFEREEYLSYLEQLDLEENKIVDLETCAKTLAGQLLGLDRFDPDMIARSLMFLIKKADLKEYGEYIDESEIEIISRDKYFQVMQKQMADMADQKKRCADSVKSLKDQICGQDDIDDFKVSQNLKTLLWLNDERVQLDEKINIQRKV